MPSASIRSITGLAAGDSVTFGYSDLATPTAVTAAAKSYVMATSSNGIAYTAVVDLDPLDNFSGGIDTSQNVNEVELGLTQASALVVYIVTQEAVVPSA